MAYTDIDKPSDYFETKLFTGNGGTQSITSLDFSPSLCWIKNRTAVGEGHHWYDVVRSATKRLRSDTSVAESTVSNGLTAFGTNGFTVGDRAGVNGNGNGIASWNWKAGTSFTNDASATGIGSIDSAGSFNNDAGFSICTFTGTGSAGTIKHGLNTVPKMIIVKGRSEAKAWTVYHSALGAGKAIFLEQTSASTTSDAYFGGTTPTSSVFSVGSSTNVTGNGITFVAYCFADKQGYSKFGSYVGTGNSDGAYIHLGFKPAFLMIKQSSGTNFWLMRDNKRDPFNVSSKTLNANGADTEASWGTTYLIDYLSSGFKCRDGTSPINSSGGTYIYMAFAENPFVTSTGVPATAR